MKVAQITRTDPADVYNLEVEDTHDFVIQGGVIAHNCADEVRYMCMARPIKPRMAPVPDEYTEKNPMSVYLDIPKEQLMPAKHYGRIEIIQDTDEE